MRYIFAAIAAAAFVCFLAPGANAMTVGTAPGIQHSLADINVVEKVVRVCRRDVRTGQRVCWIDRSRPPTVCHRVRGRDGIVRLDCY
jgi:hypothetical protein